MPLGCRGSLKCFARDDADTNRIDFARDSLQRKPSNAVAVWLRRLVGKRRARSFDSATISFSMIRIKRNTKMGLQALSPGVCPAAGGLGGHP